MRYILNHCEFSCVKNIYFFFNLNAFQEQNVQQISSNQNLVKKKAKISYYYIYLLRIFFFAVLCNSYPWAESIAYLGLSILG